MIKTRYPDIYIDGEDIFKLINGSYHKLCKWIDNVGYYQVSFRVGGKKIYRRVHKIIADELLPNPLGLPMIDHIDGNKLNNKLENLMWVNNSTNTKSSYNAGLYKSKYRCGVIATDKVTGKQFTFPSIRSCADTLKINRKTLTSILKGTKKTNNYNYEFEYL